MVQLFAKNTAINFSAFSLRAFPCGLLDVRQFLEATPGQLLCLSRGKRRKSTIPQVATNSTLIYGKVFVGSFSCHFQDDVSMPALLTVLDKTLQNLRHL